MNKKEVYILEQNTLSTIYNSVTGMQPYRSGGFINKDYDFGRVTIDLPIIEAKKLIAQLEKIKELNKE